MPGLENITEASCYQLFLQLLRRPKSICHSSLCPGGSHLVTQLVKPRLLDTGAGANMALMDAWELAEELVSGGHSSAQEAISRFAEKAPKRSAGAIKFSRFNIAMVHSEGWRKRLVVLLLKAVGSALNLLRTLQSASRTFRPKTAA